MPPYMLPPSAADRTLSDAFTCAFGQQAVFVFDGGEQGGVSEPAPMRAPFGGVTALLFMAMMEQDGWGGAGRGSGVVRGLRAAM